MHAFYVDTTCAASAIDHFAVSQSLYGDIKEVEIIDSGINLSDHLPLVLSLCITVAKKPVAQQIPKYEAQHLNFRWDHGDIFQYYALTHDFLHHINVPTHLLTEDVSLNQSHAYIHGELNRFYSNIVCALYEASCIAIHRKKQNFYKFWWDQELVLLKEKAIQSFNLWTAVGKPRSGKEFDYEAR